MCGTGAGAGLDVNVDGKGGNWLLTWELYMRTHRSKSNFGGASCF